VHKKRDALGIYCLRPGITGLAQVRGRDMASDDEKVLWDYEYLEKISFITDIKIAFLTLGNVMVGKNISMGKDRSAKKEKKAKG
jgi:O-antigen biosynthesis protein WbqP